MEEFFSFVKERIEIPSSIFSKELGGLESVTKYLKENLGLSYHEIANLLGRDDRYMRAAYEKSVKNISKFMNVEKTQIFILISIFNEKLTVLESVIVYLKEKDMKYSEIAELIGRNKSNILNSY